MGGKIMFEIYRESAYEGDYKVVYFSELDDHNKEVEIGRALAGEHFYDGFIRADMREQAREEIAEILDHLNSGEGMTPADVELHLTRFMPA
jgi:hypothetical protein